LAERGVISFNTSGGLVSWINLSPANFLAHGEELLRREPCATVALKGDGPLGEVLVSPLLGRIRSLRLQDAPAGPGTAEALARSPYLGNLKDIDLCPGLSDEELAAFVASPHLRLERFRSNGPVGPATLKALATGNLWPRLKRAELQWDSALDADGIARLAAMPSPALEDLWLSRLNLPDEAAFALAGADWPALKSLWLGQNRIGWDGLAALITSERLASLDHLDTEINALRGQRPARQWPTVKGKFRRLKLFCNDLTDDDVAMMCGLPWLSGLGRLDLGGNQITDAGAETLAGSPVWMGLSALEMGQNRIGPVGTRALMAAEWAAGLKDLSLYHNPTGDDGAEAISASENATALEKLSLSDCGIGDRGMVALASSPYLARVQELYISGNRIGVEGATALSRWPGKALRRLSVDEDGLPDDVKAALKARTEVGPA
jgi:hypothetical protein